MRLNECLRFFGYTKVVGGFILGSILLINNVLAATPKLDQPQLREGQASKAEAYIDELYQIAVFAGGSFWCMEAPFDEVDGVISTEVGFTGGHTVNPTYKQVVMGTTGHKEAVRIVFDARVVSYDALLKVFWRNVDPFDGEGQFCDKGPQYLSAIYYVDEAQRRAVHVSLDALQDKPHKPNVYKASGQKHIVTQVHPLTIFYPAEAYHQGFYFNHPKRYRFYLAGCQRQEQLTKLWQVEEDGQSSAP